MTYVCSFCLWPSKLSPWHLSMFACFRAFRAQTEMFFTEEEFEKFRDDMLKDGFALREVTRVPYNNPEQVM